MLHAIVVLFPAEAKHFLSSETSRPLWKPLIFLLIGYPEFRPEAKTARALS